MEKLRKIYYDDLGGLSFAELTRIAQKKKLNLTTEEIRDFYNAQRVNQVTKQKRILKRYFYRILAPYQGFIVADLMDYSNFHKSNKGYKYILTAIDTYSRFAWAFPLKTKSPEEVLPHFKQINEDLEKAGHKWETFTADFGNEFLGPVKKYLKDLDVKTYVAHSPGDSSFKFRAAVVERFNRTLNERLTKATIINDDTSWITVLPKVLSSYNKSLHSSTGRIPTKLILKGKPRGSNAQTHAPSLKIGDLVRKAINKDGGKIGGIDKKRELRGVNTFEPEVYQIIYREGYRYYLAKPGSLERIPGSYLERQLAKTNKDSGEENAVHFKQEAEKKEVKKVKKIVTDNRRSGLDVDKEGNIVQPRPERLLGRKGAQELTEKRTKKVPSRLLD